MRPPSHEDSRREFIRGSSLLLAGAVPAALATASSGGGLRPAPATLRIGLIGCGVRGTAAAAQALSSLGVDGRLVAVADCFDDRLQQACRTLKSKFPEKYAVAADRRFSGLDAYQGLMATDVELVILATSPGFRPVHVAAAIAAGKHVFAEKPVATDAPGVRSFMASCELAQQRQLAISVGLQRRHMASYQQTIAQLQRGAIGQLVFARVYCNRPLPGLQPRRRGQSELEYQLRNWQQYDWAGGGSIVEEHVQNLDVINWLLGEHPLEARCVNAQDLARQGPALPADALSANGHQAVEYTYRNGFRLLSVTQSTGRQHEASEWVYGTHGSCNITQGKVFDLNQQLIWKADGAREGYQAEFETLFAAFRHQQIPAEGRYAAESTLTAILGRTASYLGTRVRWGDCFASGERLADYEALASLACAAPVA